MKGKGYSDQKKIFNSELSINYRRHDIKGKKAIAHDFNPTVSKQLALSQKILLSNPCKLWC
ncbi:hypothetical protein [Iningainema tapete]|uniref:Uncharacterized protein n=1 Tax=Iningainema tapete BLCC-T55 TaxID=2748662 RepID=A0A8J6XJ72_9CYAN|nr:hypothetical protein [Iningainema tapete]MBD2772459.1 hypothetical protein [Iningainema tapete BLCC-T55]